MYHAFQCEVYIFMYLFPFFVIYIIKTSENKSNSILHFI